MDVSLLVTLINKLKLKDENSVKMLEGKNIVWSLLKPVFSFSAWRFKMKVHIGTKTETFVSKVRQQDCLGSRLLAFECF